MPFSGLHDDWKHGATGIRIVNKVSCFCSRRMPPSSWLMALTLLVIECRHEDSSQIVCTGEAHDFQKPLFAVVSHPSSNFRIAASTSGQSLSFIKVNSQSASNISEQVIVPH